MSADQVIKVDPSTGIAADSDSLAAARRAVGLAGTSMATPSQSNGKLPLFDGTKETTDYPTWSSLAIIEILLADDDKSSLRTLLHALRGTPLTTVTGGVSRATTAAQLALTSGKDVLDKLDPMYGATSEHAKASARQELSRLRQGKKTFPEYLAEVSRLGTLAGLAPADLVPEIMAGIEGRLAPVAASGIGKSWADFTQSLLTADRMVPRFKKQEGGQTHRGRGVQSDTDTRTCYNCNEKGHISTNCPKPKKPKKGKGRKVEDDDDDTRSVVSYSPNE